MVFTFQNTAEVVLASHSAEIFENQELKLLITAIEYQDKRAQRFKLVEELEACPFSKDVSAANLGGLDDQRLRETSGGISYTVAPNQASPPVIGDDFFG